MRCGFPENPKTAAHFRQTLLLRQGHRSRRQRRWRQRCRTVHRPGLELRHNRTMPIASGPKHGKAVVPHFIRRMAVERNAHRLQRLARCCAIVTANGDAEGFVNAGTDIGHDEGEVIEVAIGSGRASRRPRRPSHCRPEAEDHWACTLRCRWRVAGQCKDRAGVLRGLNSEREVDKIACAHALALAVLRHLHHRSRLARLRLRSFVSRFRVRVPGQRTQSDWPRHTCAASGQTRIARAPSGPATATVVKSQKNRLHRILQAELSRAVKLTSRAYPVGCCLHRTTLVP